MLVHIRRSVVNNNDYCGNIIINTYWFLFFNFFSGNTHTSCTFRVPMLVVFTGKRMHDDIFCWAFSKTTDGGGG